MTHRLFTVKRCWQGASFYKFESKIVPAHFLCVLTLFFSTQISSVRWRETKKKLKNFYLVPGRKSAELPLKVIKSFLLLSHKNRKNVSLVKSLGWFLPFIPARIFNHQCLQPPKNQTKIIFSFLFNTLLWKKKF